MANQQKESYQHLSPTYPQIPEIREENARQYLVGDIIGGFPFASGSFTDSGGFYLGRDSNDGCTARPVDTKPPATQQQHDDSGRLRFG